MVEIPVFCTIFLDRSVMSVDHSLCSPWELLIGSSLSRHSQLETSCFYTPKASGQGSSS